MSNTRTTRTSKTRTTKPELTRTLGTITLTEARESLDALDRDWGVIPPLGRAGLERALDKALDKAEQIKMTRVNQLISSQASLLKALTGTDNVTQMHRTDDAVPLHTYRNVITAVAAAAAAHNKCNPEDVYASAVRLRARTAQTVRPLADDEIFLLRIQAALATAAKPTDKPAGIYAMADAGLNPSETTSVSLSSFADLHRPTQISAPGHGNGLAARFLPLDRFGSTILAEHIRGALAANHHRGTPLTYRPRHNQPGSDQATASAHGVINRCLTALGLKHKDVTASSIALWRVHTIYTHQGIDAAAEFSGRSSAEQMLSFLFRCLPISISAPDKKVKRFDID